MKKNNRELLEQVIEDRLNKCLENTDDNDISFEEAMQAIEKQTELDKIKKEKIVKFVEIGALVVAAPLIEAGCKKAFAKMICTFEQDYTFTTTAGRALSSLFRFK